MNKVKIIMLILIIFSLFLTFIPFLSNTEVLRHGIWYSLGDLNANYTSARIQLLDEFEHYHQIGINEIFVLTKSSEGYIFYNSNISNNHYFEWDPLKLACEIANQFNLLIHAWICVGRDYYLVNQNSSYAMCDVNGQTSDWVNFALPEVKTYYFNIMSEIIQNYAVKGIHLDYIRYPSYYSYDPYSRTVFEKIYGFDPIDNANAPEWKEWRKQQVTDFVNQTYIMIKSFDLNKELSCAVFPEPEGELQDWVYWENFNMVDFLVGMAYTADMNEFRGMLDNIKQRWSLKIPLLIGVGIYAYHDKENAKEIFENQIKMVINYGFNGWVLFRNGYLDPFTPFYDNLILWLKFDGNLMDSSKNAYHAQSFCTPLKFEDGISGKALYLDGIDDYVSVPDKPEFSIVNNPNGLTISFWISPATLQYPTANEYGYIRFFGKGMPNEYEWNFVIYNAENSVNRPNDICFYIHNRTGGYGIGAYVREVITINEWIFITGVIQDDVLKIYKNGVLKNASRNYTGIIIPEDGNAPLNIGKRDYPEFFMGKIDDVRIYSYALSDDEILNLYHSYFSKTYKILYISAIHIEDDAIYVTPVYVTDVFHDTINCILRFRVLEHPLGHQQLLSASTNTSDALKPINELPILKILNVSDIVEINYKNCNYTQLSVEQEPLTNNYWITYAGQANSVTINSTEIPEFTFVAIIATLLFAALGIIIFKVLVPCIRE